MTKKLILLILTLLSLFIGLSGINWDTPNAKREKRILHPEWNLIELFDNLAGNWQEIYDISKNTTPLLAEGAGRYSTRLKGIIKIDSSDKPPPKILFNSYRSMIVRTRYPDESLLLSNLSQMKPGELKFRPPSFLYGGAYIYPLGVYYLTLSKTGIIQMMSMRRFLENPEALGRIYTAGRFLSLICFVGICIICYFIVLELSNFSSGILSFLTVMTTPIIFIYSHYLTPHLWAVFWGLLSIFFLIKFLNGLRLKEIILSGICFGISAGSYWTQIPSVGFFLTLILLSLKQEILQKETLKKISLAVAISALTFIIFNPYIFEGWRLAAEELLPKSSSVRFSPLSNIFSFFLKFMPKTAGITCALSIIGGYIWGVTSKKPLIRNLSLSCILLLPLVFFTVTTASEIRRHLVWLIMSVLLAVMFISSILSKLPLNLKAILLSLFILPGVIISSTYALNFIKSSTNDSNFSKMADMLDSIKTKERLGLLEFPQPIYAPHFKIYRWNLFLINEKEIISPQNKELPEYLLVNLSQKKEILKVLESKYEKICGFYPKKFVGLEIDPGLCPINVPIELYKLL